MMQLDRQKIESLRRFLRNFSQLMLSHFTMRLVLDSINLFSVFQGTNISKKLNHRTCAGGSLWRNGAERGAHQCHFTIAICHLPGLLVYCIALN